MRRIDLINKISSKNVVPSVNNMQVLDEQSEAYFNFINSLQSESTKESYRFCLEKFLNHYGIDLLSFLKLSQQDTANLIIKYLVDKKISKQYKSVIMAALKHACEINDVVLNWKKIKKFINFKKTGNETNGRDRAYTHQEIQKIIGFCDQRIRTSFLLLASTGMRIGALHTLKVEDLEKIDNIFKIIVYAGDKEELDVQETRQIIGPNSYNDNWDLVNYTSELRDSKGEFFAFVDFNGDSGKIRECPHCLEYEIHNKLRPRILEKGEVKPPDYDDFVQCYECGNVFPIYQSYPESEIKDSLETTDNPFENSESIFLSTDSRATQRRKGKKHKSKFKIGQHHDSEIQAAIDKGLAVNILYDSNR